jgi:hypothetical protein
MTENLLNRIQREMQDRMEQLRGAVEERDRLQAELKALEADLQPVAELRPPAALRLAAQVPHAAVPRESPPPRLVSPKVLRLMCGRPSFARPVGPRGSRGVNLARQEPVTLGAGEVR